MKKISSYDIQAIIFSGVGVLLLGFSVPQLVQGVARIIFADSPHVATLHAWGAIFPVDSLLQFGMGLGLFLGARGLARFWHWLRTAGLPPAD